ncbi:uncharacterized protein [Haliotis cracherodii]|uniref:uncharacterized protein n=1 Tax=Haliotis cracherodii TaxID=6455 RepID=UPI0039EB6877
MNFSALYMAVAFAFLTGKTTMFALPLDNFCKSVNDMGYSNAEKTLTDAVNALGKYNEKNTETAMETVLQMLAVSHIKYCNEVEASKKGN